MNREMIFDNTSCGKLVKAYPDSTGEGKPYGDNVHEPAKDRNKQNRENKNRVKKVIDRERRKRITLETPKTEEQKGCNSKKATVQRHRKRKKILSAYIMHRMQVTAGRTERNQLERESHVHRAHVLQHRHSRQRKQRHL